MSVDHEGPGQTARHIYLLGFRGCGKTTVGRLLAERLGRPFLDTDDCIEELAGKTIAEIFRQVGESGFRDLEQQVIEQCAALPHSTVIALGGGAILRQINRDHIRRTGHRIWLHASPETHYRRIVEDAASASRRPALTSHDAFAEIQEILKFREPLYADLAEKTCKVDAMTPDQIVGEIIDWLNSAS